MFSKLSYVALATLTTVGLFFPLSIMSEYFFVQPFLTWHVPSDRVFGFFLIIALSVMSGIVLTVNIYRIRTLRNSVKKIGGGFLGSIIGVSAGVCSCGSIGFAAVSTFGTVGGIATSFLTNYEIPLRLVALAILGYTYYATTKAISSECKIKLN